MNEILPTEILYTIINFDNYSQLVSVCKFHSSVCDTYLLNNYTKLEYKLINNLLYHVFGNKPISETLKLLLCNVKHISFDYGGRLKLCGLVQILNMNSISISYEYCGPNDELFLCINNFSCSFDVVYTYMKECHKREIRPNTHIIEYLRDIQGDEIYRDRLNGKDEFRLWLQITDDIEFIVKDFVEQYAQHHKGDRFVCDCENKWTKCDPWYYLKFRKMIIKLCKTNSEVVTYLIDLLIEKSKLPEESL